MASAQSEHALFSEQSALTCLRQRLEQVQYENSQLSQRLFEQQEQCDCIRTKLKGVLQENDALYQTQEKLESEVYSKGQEMETLFKENQHWKRVCKELDKSLTTEREEFDKERSSWQHRETSFVEQIRQVKQQYQQAQLLNRQQKQQESEHQYHPYHRSSKRKNGLACTFSVPHFPSVSDNKEGSQVVPSYEDRPSVNLLQHHHQHQSDTKQAASLSQTDLMTESGSDSSVYQETIRAQAKEIAVLTLDLQQQTTKLHQHLMESHEASLHIKQLVDQVTSMKQLNQSLMEENESYQMLLHEKTMSGDFISDPILQFTENDQVDNYGDQESDDSDSFGSQNISRQKELLRRKSAPDTIMMMSHKGASLNLADELTMASSQESVSNEKKMADEIKALQDANRALQLYMNKILLRIVENKHLENILSIDEPKQSSAMVKPLPTTPLAVLSTKASSARRIAERQSVSYCSFNTNGTPSTTVFQFYSEPNRPQRKLSTSSESTVNGTSPPATPTLPSNNHGDSWCQVFRRMSSGFGGWSKSANQSTVESSSETREDHHKDDAILSETMSK